MNLNQDTEVLEEGPIGDLWTSAKYKLSRLGSITKGGKYFGKKKLTADAEAQLDAAIERLNKDVKQGAVLSLRSLDKIIKTNSPDFPNIKEPEKFQQGVDMIGATYDSIVAATKKNPDDKGYLPIDIANELIAGLRLYVEKMIDYDLSSVYRMFKEAEGDAPNQPLGGKGQSKTIGVYQSKKLPVALILAGIGLKGLEWLINYFAEGTELVTVMKDASQATKPGEGLTQFLQRATNIDLGPNAPSENMIKALTKVGGGSLETGMQNISTLFVNNGAGDPITQANQIAELATNKGTISDMFNTASQTFGSGSGGQNLFSIKGVASAIIKKAATQTVKSAGVTAALKPLAPWLGGLGIAAVAAGVTVLALRQKGLKSSRMQVLNDLLQRLQDVAGEEVLTPIGQEPEQGGATTSDTTQTTTPVTPGDNKKPSDPKAQSKLNIASFFKNIGKIKKSGLSEAKNLSLDSDLGFKKGQVKIVKLMLDQLIQIKKDLNKLKRSKDTKLGELANNVLLNPVFSEVKLNKLFSSPDMKKLKTFFINFVETGNRVDLFAVNEAEDTNDNNRKIFLTNYKKFLQDLYKVHQYLRYKGKK
jgi:hypothetical protein